MRYQLKTLLSSLILFIAGCATCKVPGSFLASVEKLRGLEFREKVVCRSADSREMKEYLRRSLMLKVSRERLEREELVYKLLGIVPPEFDYIESLLDIYGDRFSAFYSPELGFYVMPRGQAADDALAAHELTHVLQDQHYDVEKLLRPELPLDEILARSAVFEGDANIVALRFERLPVCEDVEEDLLAALESRVRTAARVPRAIELLLSFPYLYGERYVCRMSAEGKNLDALYRRLPQTTKAIIELSDPVTLLAARPDPSAEYEDRFGAFGTFAVAAAEASLADSSFILRDWRGDRLVLHSDGAERQIDWRVEFSSAEAAQRFAALLAGRTGLSVHAEEHVVRVTRSAPAQVRAKRKDAAHYRFSAGSDIAAQEFKTAQGWP